MPDPLIIERLELILGHAQTIHSRSKDIMDAGHFISSEAGEQLYDEAKTSMLNEHGIKVIRFWNDEVMNEPEKVLEKIEECLC